MVSAQNRNRYYWTSFPVDQPKDKGVLLNYITDRNVDNKFYVSKVQLDRLDTSDVGIGGCKACFSKKGVNASKSETLMARDYKGISKKQHFTMVMEVDGLRRLTPTECMRLQTVPEDKIDILLNSGISNTQLYKMTGNGWTVDVIAHILKGLK